MSVPTGRIKIVGAGAQPGRPITGQDIRVLLVGHGPDGNERTMLVPALSLVLRVGSRHEQAVATIEVPAVMVDIEGVELRTEAVVAPGGPESQWEESLGYKPGAPIADVDQYTDTPGVVAGETMAEQLAREMREGTAVFVSATPPQADPMAELDAVIARGGKIE